MGSDPPKTESAPSGEWRRALILFLLTVGSVFFTAYSGKLVEAAQFTGALLGILVTHELGHYVTARLHRVAASPPFFIPMPVLSPFGTMGAIIRMNDRIGARRALLDIGACGPLAGLVVAIPLYFYGASHSRFVEIGSGGVTLGESVLLKLLDRAAAGPAPAGMTLELSPIAFAAWGGLFVTMINLLPVGQLDGGHVAYALFGRRQDRFAPIIHRSLLALFFVNLVSFVARDLRAGVGFDALGRHIGSSMFWLVWFEVLAVLGTLSSHEEPERRGVTTLQRVIAIVGLVMLSALGQEFQPHPLFWLAWFVGLALLLAMERRGGVLRKTSTFDHPPTDSAPLGAWRTVVAIITLVFFALLFMPAPIVL